MVINQTQLIFCHLGSTTKRELQAMFLCAAWVTGYNLNGLLNGFYMLNDSTRLIVLLW